MLPSGFNNSRLNAVLFPGISIGSFPIIGKESGIDGLNDTSGTSIPSGALVVKADTLPYGKNTDDSIVKISTKDNKEK
jgi:hypothetical protein